MRKTAKRIVCALSILIVLFTTLAVPTFAEIPAAQQKFWNVFNYNEVYLNMGYSTFREHWNKARDAMPMMVHFGTQRVGYSNIHIPAFLDEMYEYYYDYDWNDEPYLTVEKGTFQDGFYLGHGNGFIYAGDGLDVPAEYCYMGHLYQRNTLYVPNSNSTRSLTVELIYVKGALTNWNKFDITEFEFDNGSYDYEILKTVYKWDYYSSDSGGDYEYQGAPAFSYRSRIGGTTSAWRTLSDGEYYGFMFGQTAGAIWNEHMNGSIETIFYSWFEGPFGIDEETDGMTGQRFGMVSPLFYQEGYDTFYEPIFNDGYEEGYNYGYEDGESNGYSNGYEYGYVEGADDGYYSGYIKAEENLTDYYDSYWSTHYNSEAYGNAVQESIESEDSNPVTAFFNSMWNGIINAYDTVTSNVSIGGVSLAMVITTLIVAFLLVWFVSKVK